MTRPRLVVPLALVALSACDPDKGKTASVQPEAASLSPAPSASALPVPTPSASAAPPTAVCKVESSKAWGNGVNMTTGLTATKLDDGRIAIGFAFGYTPQVLVVGGGGQGALLRVGVKPGTRLATPPTQADGARHLFRVTPVRVSDKQATAFVDFRDDMKNKKRHVRCGAAESEDAWVFHDEVSVLDKLANHYSEELGLLGLDVQKGDFHEIRDCRTFVGSESNAPFVLGTKLIGKRVAEGTPSDAGAGKKVAWKSALFVDTGPNVPETILYESPLAGDPPRPFNYETPVAQTMSDGRTLFATRYGGSLLVGFLGKGKGLEGPVKTYGGGFTMPELGDDGTDLILTTSLSQKGEYKLRALRVAVGSKSFPAATTEVVTDQAGMGSETDPYFILDAKGRRWVSHLEGPRGKAKLSIAPVDAELKATGPAYTVTQGDETASAARLVPRKDGKILVVWVRNTPKGNELVSEEIACEGSK